MTSAYDVASYLLAKDTDRTMFPGNVLPGNGREVDEGNARLNFYLHISQNIYIARTGRKLFEEDLYASDNGAVIPSIQQNYAMLQGKSEGFDLDEEKAAFLDRICHVLKNAGIDELLVASREDPAWIETTNYGCFVKMDSLAHSEEYSKQYSDMLKIIDSFLL